MTIGMSNLLYLVHRVPFPPNKGDKVRSFNLLKHLSAQHRIFLGTFVDDVADITHLATVRKYCVDMHVSQLSPLRAKFKSLKGLVNGKALSLEYYREQSLLDWVKSTLTSHKIDAIVVFSSAMGQYAIFQSEVPVLVDFVDVDSAKWTAYSGDYFWPLSWLYKREGEKLLAYERQLAMKSKRSFFVTENEADLFCKSAPECRPVVRAMSNGVESNYFAPDPHRESPFNREETDANRIRIVFTGAMDYWPNIDAVTWFARDVLPSLQNARPDICFYIVGRNPAPAVLALAGNGVVVTGTVPDVRPYLQYATLVVAPLRIARGIQNKILEAMAMGRPVVASEACALAMNVRIGIDLIAADTDADFVREISSLITDDDRIGKVSASGRERVLEKYSWAAHLSEIDRCLAQLLPRVALQ